MTEMGNLDGGKKADWNRAAPLAVIAIPLVLAGGFMKRQAVITVIKYRDSSSQEQTLVIDFLVDVGSAQPLIYSRFLEAKTACKDCGNSNPVGSSFCAKWGTALKVNGEVICQKCATKSVAGSAFCSKCGSALD